MPATNFQLRDAVQPSDVNAVRDIVASTGFFSAAEVAIAADLVSDRLEKGPTSGYEFVFLNDPSASDRLMGYACYGTIPCTVDNYDLYWIVVAKECQGTGIGTLILAEVESRVRQLQGRQLYAETSGRSLYDPTRRFYERHDYVCQAILPDFYSPGDAKHIFVKRIAVSKDSSRG